MLNVTSEKSDFFYRLSTSYDFLHTPPICEGINPSRPNPGRREKIKLNSYFRTSVWCLKWFYEGHKTF